MRNHFGGGDRTEPPALPQRQSASQPMQEARGEQVTGTGRVDHLADRDSGHFDHVVRRHNDRTVGTDSDGGQRALCAQHCNRLVKRFRLVERQQLGLVAEQQVDLVVDEREKVVTVTIDTKRVGERERHHSGGTVGDSGGVPKCLLGLGPVVQVTLHIEHLTGGHDDVIDITHAEQARCAEVGVHGAFGVRRDDDDATPGRDRIAVIAGLELHSDREQVVAEHLAELIVADLADIRRGPTETSDPTHRVGGRSATHFDGRSECAIQLERPIGVDQIHPALHQAVFIEERVGGMGNHVDKRISDANDIEQCTVT